MITTDNYFEEVSHIDPSSLPETLRKGHDFVVKATENGASWESYYGGENTRKAIDLYLSKLNEWASTRGEASKKRKTYSAPKRKKSSPSAVTSQQKELPQMPPATHEPNPADQPDWVERIPEELRFIRRFVNMNAKKKTKEEIVRFINALQKAIVDKRIRKTSAYADQIRFIQDKLIAVYKSMKATIRIQLKPETEAELKKITGEQKVPPSINFIKRYIGISGKPGMKQKAIALLEQIERSSRKGKISKNDRYYQDIHTIVNNLRRFREDKKSKVLVIESKELNGFQAILNGCACQPLNGYEEPPALMNSMDFANMRFVTIGLKGKWYDLIGDPSPNFTAMVFGKPKMGKSYFCINFAGYLARNHGRVLYVAKEEGLDMTLQKKLADQQVAHPNLFVSAELPDTLERYDFIFLDSVNRLGLFPADLYRLKADHPDKSFIFVFQTTKDGNFRGANSFQHDVDVVIEIPEKGVARQYGRFNQGGEMEIFGP